MKPWLIILVAAVLLAGAAYWWISRSPNPSQAQPLPEDRNLVEPRRIPLH